jgi:hypothetical protein
MSIFIASSSELIQGEDYLIHYPQPVKVKKISTFVKSNDRGNIFFDIDSNFILTDNYINTSKVRLEHIKSL